MAWMKALAILATCLCGGLASHACIRRSERITEERGPWRSESYGMFMLGCVGVPILSLGVGIWLLCAIR